ncbi:MAG: BON domain-containing protein [Limnobacter sp.]|nr:BON domain-containing protein [Limnobacter sp.]
MNYRLGKTLAVLALFLAVACDSKPGTPSTGEYIDDSVITTKLKSAIVNDPTLKSTEINVETYKGTVQLSGFVNSVAEMTQAEVLARSIGGVSAVKNDIRLKNP